MHTKEKKLLQLASDQGFEQPQLFRACLFFSAWIQAGCQGRVLHKPCFQQRRWQLIFSGHHTCIDA